MSVFAIFWTRSRSSKLLSSFGSLSFRKLLPPLRFRGGGMAVIACFALAAAAAAQDAGRVARCVAIRDVDERIECLEGRSSAPEVSTPGRSRAPPGWAEFRLPNGDSVNRAGDLRRRGSFGVGPADGPAVSASSPAQEAGRSPVPHRQSTVVDTTKKHGVWRGSRQCCVVLRA